MFFPKRWLYMEIKSYSENTVGSHICTTALPNKVIGNSSFITETVCDLQKSGHEKLPVNFVLSFLGQAAAEVHPESLPWMCMWLSLPEWCRLCNLDSRDGYLMTWSWVQFHDYPKRNADQHRIYFGKGKVINSLFVSRTPARSSLRGQTASASCRGLPKHFKPCVGHTKALIITSGRNCTGTDMASGQARSWWHLSLWKWSLLHSWVTIWTQVTLESTPVVTVNTGLLFYLPKFTSLYLLASSCHNVDSRLKSFCKNWFLWTHTSICSCPLYLIND